MKLIYLVLLVPLGWAVYTDLTQTKIRNWLIVVGLLTGFFYRIVIEGSLGVLFFFANISIPVILLNLLFQMRALGAGDIKLFSMLGAFLSTEQLLKIMVSAFVIGAILGIFKMIYQFLFKKIEFGKRTYIHFSPAILIAYLFVVWR